MKNLLLILLSFCIYLSAWADNFVINHGESVKLFAPRGNGSATERADVLFSDDYHEVFGEFLVHTNRIDEARIIACNYDHPELKKYAKIRGLKFDALQGRKESFMLKVHNNGKQLFVIGSDDRGTAFGLMTLSHDWGVSPYRWWVDAPALPIESFELGVAYEKLVTPSIATRTLILNGAQEHDKYLQDLMLRLRVSGVTNVLSATSDQDPGVFRWTLDPAIQPYLGLSLALDHPERIRLEAFRALAHGCNKEWQFYYGHQLGGELQMLLFFDMAWDVESYRDLYAVDMLEDRHFTQMSGIENSWSRIWNDYYDLVMSVRPDQPQSLETLRRVIGESQSLGLQLSLDLSEKTVRPEYANAFFRTVEYPLNMASAQIQRLCNIQLAAHDLAKPWAVDDCRQRMELLASELPGIISQRWRQMMGGIQMPSIVLGQSLMRTDNYKVSKLEVGAPGPLPADETTMLLFRSARAIGTHIKPYEAFRLPAYNQDDSLHLRLSFMPVRKYDKPMRCMVSVDKGEAQLIDIPAESFPQEQYVVRLVFAVDSQANEHEIVIMTPSDDIYLQRMWLDDMKLE